MFCFPDTGILVNHTWCAQCGRIKYDYPGYGETKRIDACTVTVVSHDIRAVNVTGDAGDYFVPAENKDQAG